MFKLHCFTVIKQVICKKYAAKIQICPDDYTIHKWMPFFEEKVCVQKGKQNKTEVNTE